MTRLSVVTQCWCFCVPMSTERQNEKRGFPAERVGTSLGTALCKRHLTQHAGAFTRSGWYDVFFHCTGKQWRGDIAIKEPPSLPRMDVKSNQCSSTPPSTIRCGESVRITFTNA